MNEPIQKDKKEDRRRLRSGRYPWGNRRSKEENGTYTGDSSTAYIQCDGTNAPDSYSGSIKTKANDDSGIF